MPPPSTAKKKKKQETASSTTHYSFLEMKNPYHICNLKTFHFHFDKMVVDKLKKSLPTRPGEKKRAIALLGRAGSGKTRILKKIAKFPRILGKNLLPVFLDARQYIELPEDNFLMSIQKNIQEARENYFLKKGNGKAQTEQSIGQREFSGEFKNPLVLLIFDELQDLVEHSRSGKFSAIIDYIKQFDSILDDYALIFAEDISPHYPDESGSMEKHLKTQPIYVEDTFEEQIIERYITSPVKDHLFYSLSSKKKIKKLCGGNLYFQQLICHYLVNYLKEEYRNVCLVSDINKVVERILGDERPEFPFTWEKKLSPVERIVMAALADEYSNRQLEDVRFLEDFGFLDQMLNNRFLFQLRKLYNAGYVNDFEIEQRIFFGSPFTLPLWGKWLRRHHPYVRTLLEHIGEVAERVDFEALLKRIAGTPGEKLSPFDKEAILNTGEKWTLFKEELQKSSSEKKGEGVDFIYNLGKLVELQVEDISSSPTSVHNLVLDLKDLNIGSMRQGYCLLQDRLDLKEDDIPHLETIARARAADIHSKLVLFFCPRKTDCLIQLEKQLFLNFVVVEENDLKRIVFSERPSIALRELLLERLPLNKLSPYKIAGPVKETFYGRVGIIGHLVHAREVSFALVGPRKIGKSSILHRVLENLQENSSPGTYCVFLSLEVEFAGAEDYSGFLESLASQIERVIGKPVDFKENPQTIPTVIDKLTQWGKKSIVFLFDEIDELISFDKQHNYRLMKIFRALDQKGYCRFILAGFKELYHEKRGISAPQYNFYEEIRLANLDKDAAQELITKPMNNMGIDYRDDEDKELIYDYTSRHPNLLQFFCKQLVERVKRHKNLKERRLILRDDIEGLLNAEFEAYIVDEVYMFYSDLSALEKLIVVSMGENESLRLSFSTDEVAARLKAYNIHLDKKSLQKIMRELVMRFIFKDEGRENYSFALSTFPDILEKIVDEDYRNNLVKEVLSDG